MSVVTRRLDVVVWWRGEVMTYASVKENQLLCARGGPGVPAPALPVALTGARGAERVL